MSGECTGNLQIEKLKPISYATYLPPISPQNVIVFDFFFPNSEDLRSVAAILFLPSTCKVLWLQEARIYKLDFACLG